MWLFQVVLFPGFLKMLKISHCSSDINLSWHQKTRSETNDNSRMCVHVHRYALSNVTVKTSGAINNSLLKASSDQKEYLCCYGVQSWWHHRACLNMKKRLLVTEREEMLYTCIQHCWHKCVLLFCLVGFFCTN